MWFGEGSVCYVSRGKKSCKFSIYLMLSILFYEFYELGDGQIWWKSVTFVETAILACSAKKLGWGRRELSSGFKVSVNR